MTDVKIITDGCSDIPSAWREEHDIDCVPIAFVNSVGERLSSCEFDEIAARRFYDAMSNGVMYKPSAALQSYENVFERYAAAGRDIVYIAGASALFPSFTAGTLVAKRICEKYDGVKIFCVDTKTVGGAQALVAVRTAKYAQTARNAQAVFEYASSLSECARYVVTSDSFEHLKRSGKVRAAASLFGNLFGIKPIMSGNASSGAIDLIKKVMGRRNALELCADIICDIAVGGKADSNAGGTVCIAHADCAEECGYIADKVRAKCGGMDVFVESMGVATSALFGPTSIGLYALDGKSINSTPTK